MMSFTSIFIKKYLLIFKNVESSFASTSAASNEFSGVLSPLEPLDPNKFRNIMLDKPEVSSNSVANVYSKDFCDFEIF